MIDGDQLMEQKVMFRGELEFLSNFDTTPFWFPTLNTTVKSAEHAFNALKTLDLSQRELVLKQSTPFLAKKVGRKVDLRDNWDNRIRLVAMKRIIDAKFEVEDLRNKLLKTGNIDLIECNIWHDNFWGDCTCGRNSCQKVGLNNLGLLLMKKRSEIKITLKVSSD